MWLDKNVVIKEIQTMLKLLNVRFHTIPYKKPLYENHMISIFPYNGIVLKAFFHSIDLYDKKTFI